METVVSTIAAERARAFERHGDRRGLGAAAAFGFSVLSVLFAAYVVVALVPNPGGGWWTFVNRWPLDGFEIIAEDVPSSVELRWRPGDVQAASSLL